MLRQWLELAPRLARQVSRRHVAARYKLRGTVQMRRRHHRRLLRRLSAVSHLSPRVSPSTIPPSSILPLQRDASGAGTFITDTLHLSTAALARDLCGSR